MRYLSVDLRYTPTRCFETFPRPDPDSRARSEIGELASALIEVRQAVTVGESIGLTTLYNGVDEGARGDVASLHHQLDHAVLAAYGLRRKYAPFAQ